MVTRGDDYPVHQTAQPVSHPANPTDRNHYERFFFDAYTRDGSWFFGVAGAVYPLRGIMDAAISVVHEGRQTNLRASRRMPRDFLNIDVGPIRISIVEPLRRIRVTVDSNSSGVEGEVDFVARGPAAEEGPYNMRMGPAMLMQYMRFTQHGGYEGRLRAPSGELNCSTSSVWGVRDRSWGSRPVGDRDPTSGPQMMRIAQTHGAGQRNPLLFLWAPLNFDDRVLLWTVNEGMGDTHHMAAVAAADPEADLERTSVVGHELEVADTTNHVTKAQLEMDMPSGRRHLELEPLYHFSMSGLGYGHPEWGHGMWKGELEVGHDSFLLADVDRTKPGHGHVQTVSRCVLDGEHHGIGVLEQLMGPYTARPLAAR